MAFSEFPLRGIIGIVANSAAEVQLAKKRNLHCVEMRPDLLLDRGHSESDVMEIVKQVKAADLRCLFTLRRQDHGGKFTGSDREQMEICFRAISAGTDVVDVEWDSECARELISKNVPTILSNHHFYGMLTDSELEDVTAKITALNPAAIKIVPTAAKFSDAVRMLQWVAGSNDGPKRIGFAMGGAGELSRILTCSYGGPISYATFDAPVAPGQIPIDLLQKRYRINEIGASTKIVGIASDGEEQDQWLETLNQKFLSDEYNLIAVPIKLDDYPTIQSAAEFLRMEKLMVSERQLQKLPQSIRTSHSSALAINLIDESVRSFSNILESLDF